MGNHIPFPLDLMISRMHEPSTKSTHFCNLWNKLAEPMIWIEIFRSFTRFLLVYKWYFTYTELMWTSTPSTELASTFCKKNRLMQKIKVIWENCYVYNVSLRMRIMSRWSRSVENLFQILYFEKYFSSLLSVQEMYCVFSAKKPIWPRLFSTRFLLFRVLTFN